MDIDVKEFKPLSNFVVIKDGEQLEGDVIRPKKGTHLTSTSQLGDFVLVIAVGPQVTDVKVGDVVRPINGVPIDNFLKINGEFYPMLRSPMFSCTFELTQKSRKQLGFPPKPSE